MPPNIAPNIETNFQKSALIFYVNGKKVSIHPKPPNLILSHQ